MSEVTTKPKVYFPIRWKLLIPVLAMCAGSGYFGYTFLKRSWTAEYEKLVVEFSLKRLRSVSEQMESRLTARYRELESVCQNAYRLHKLGHTSAGNSIFQSAGEDLRKDLLAISFFRPETTGKVSYFQYVHWGLLADEELPRDVVEQINRKYPLNVRALLKNRDTRFFNRSVLNEHGEPISVVTLAFFGKSMGDFESPTLILADLRGDFLSKQENAGQLGEVFWMRRDGTLLAHPSSSLTYRFAEKPMTHEARGLIESATAFGEHTTWDREGSTYLSSVVPTAIEDVFAVSEIPMQSVTGTMKNLSLGIGVAFLGLVSGLIYFLTYFAGRLTSKIRAIEVSMLEIAQGYVPTRRMRYVDEFAAVAAAFQLVAAKALHGQSPNSQSPNSSSKSGGESANRELRFSEILQIETTQIAFYQPQTSAKNPATLWDASRLGNRLWFLMGNAGGDEGSLAAVTQLAKKTLPGLRTAKSKGNESISEQLAQLNTAVFNAFKGKVWLNLTAVELHLDSGKFYVVTAAGEAPLIVPSKLSANPEGSGGTEWLEQIEPKGIAESSVAVGMRGDTAYKAFESQLLAKDSFCLFQKDAGTIDTGPVSFRPEIKNVILRNGSTSAKDLRSHVFSGPSKGTVQNTLMMAIVQFGAAAAVGTKIEATKIEPAKNEAAAA